MAHTKVGKRLDILADGSHYIAHSSGFIFVTFKFLRVL